MQFVQTKKGATLEAIIYPLLIIIIMWSIFLIDRYYSLDLYKYGVKPNTIEGLKGILFMPLIHGQTDFSHIINNSIPTFIFLSALIYFYREIAFYVVLFIWLGGGVLLWYMAANTQSYHIGMSGVIYGLFGFLFTSGMIRRYLPLQAISLFVAFLYGSMIWGVFPMEPGISWEGHLLGLAVGVIVALAFRKKGPKPPKYRYEIEEELGIEPPDLEGEWLERRKRWEEQQKRHLENKRRQEEEARNEENLNNIQVTYHYKKKSDDNNKEE
jgi:membrane associated rhomboid family serine protease